jgi:predicted AlkP superfamily pyrophosphatase or phosphodiesterase
MFFQLVVISILISSCATSSNQPFQIKKEKVVLVSIDGFRPDFYLNPAFDTPLLKSLAKNGAHAEAMEPVFPSVTYPNHTTLVTGVYPQEHGILSNTKFNWKEGPTSEWYWYVKDLKSKALWDYLSMKNLKSASIHWPVTVGASIDYLIPEIFEVKPWTEGEVWDIVDKHSTKGLQSEINRALKLEKYIGQETADHWAAKAGNYIYKKYSPNLLAVHLTMIDKIQHKKGRASKELLNELRLMEQKLENLIKDLDSNTCLLIVGDHGFKNYTKRLNINTLFVKKGWVELNKKGKIKSWKVIGRKSGAQASIYIKDKSMEKEVWDYLEKYSEGKFIMVPKSELKKLKTGGEASFAISAAKGFSIGRSLEGEAVKTHEVRGQHGYLPYGDEIQTGFIAKGCGERKGKNLGRIKNVQVAPTVLNILGVKDVSLPARALDFR